jgi:antitoxin component HigA of HigAB toxin-antitoxin module
MLKRRSCNARPKPWLLCLLGTALFLSACAAANSYKAPVAKFQTGVNQTVVTVEPYFTQLNRMEVQYRLYEKVYEQKDWGTEDLAPRFAPETIQVRVQALEVVKKYATLLAGIAGSSAPADFQKAAGELGKQSQSLADEVGKLAGEKVPAIGDPLGKLVNLLGQIEIEHERKKALETAIKAGDEPVNQLIQLLRDDTITAAALAYEDLKQRQAILLKIYNEQRKTASSPQALEQLMNQVLDRNQEAETLRAFPVRGLFDDLESAHKALVDFARTGGNPSGAAALSAQMEAFADQAQMLSDLIGSIRKASQ